MSVARRAPSKPTAPVRIEPSPNGLAKQRVADIQRARLISAMVDVAAEGGLAGATVARVVMRAGVSRRTFYELFEDREECFLAAFDEGLARISRSVSAVYDPVARWEVRIRAVLTALLSFLDVENGVGRLVIVESLGVTATLERRRHALDRVIAVVAEGGEPAKAGSELPPLTAEGIVGGALSVVHARLLQRPPGLDGSQAEDSCPELLGELVGPLMSMIVLPYLGPGAARRELQRPVPKAQATVERGVEDPLRELGMRLTYRTVRVLASVRESPGSSNREIGLAAEIADQGQISKLLTRLERLGLVRNGGLAPGKGAPNAWALTEKGREVEHAMSAGNGRSPTTSARSRR